MKVSTSLFNGIFALSLLSPGAAFAHGDHAVPGATPPGLHGGRVEEAKHSGADAHEGAEDELFFEAVLAGDELSIYPLLLPAKGGSAFLAVEPSKLESVTAKLELPRGKKTVVLKLEDAAAKKGFVTKLPSAKERRFVVRVAALHNKERKEATIQVEKE